MNIKALIVDDESNSRLTLKNMLLNFCQGVDVVGLAASVKEAHHLASSLHPDVVFLDIEMPKENGFQLLEYYDDVPFEVVFTTAYDQYAVKAFRFSAVDYLLKPIDLEELRDAIEKIAKKNVNQRKQHFDTLQHNISNRIQKIALPTLEGFIFIDIEDILYCEASNNYTVFHSQKNGKIIVSKTLKEYDELLSSYNFFRVNRSFLINMAYIQEYKKARTPIIVMKNGTPITLSATRRKGFLDKLGRV
jgi:two-component system LytT family response regulator